MRLALIAVVLAPLVARGAPLRLGDVLARVAERGPEAIAATAGVDIARADVRTAGMLANPTLTVAAGRSEPVVSGALAVKLPIFGQRGAVVDAATRALDQASVEAELARWGLRHDARLAYYGVARADEEVEIAVAGEALARRIADMAQERFTVGSGAQLDARLAALVDVRARQEVSDRRAIARVARVELARLLGVSPSTIGGPVGDGLAIAGDAPTEDALIDGARRAHPELRALAAAREAALARAHLARVERRPLPTVELGVELLDPSTCAGTSYCVGPRASVGFDLPLLNLNGGPIARAEAEARFASLRLDAAAVRIEARVRAAAETSRAAQARARFFDEEYVPSALAVEVMAREGFAVGKTGLLPLIEAERAVLDARLGRTEALHAVQASRADLEEASGVPLSTP